MSDRRLDSPPPLHASVLLCTRYLVVIKCRPSQSEARLRPRRALGATPAPPTRGTSGEIGLVARQGRAGGGPAPLRALSALASKIESSLARTSGVTSRLRTNRHKR